MNKPRTYCLAVIVTAALGVFWLHGSKLPGAPGARNQPSHRSQAARNYARLPMGFEPAAGPLEFVSRGRGYTVRVTRDRAALSLRKQSKDKNRRSGTTQVAMKLIGSDPDAALTAAAELPGKANYLIGNDPAKWRTNVPAYAKVKVQGVYPGIDLVYYGNPSELEYDFLVAPGADPKAIQLDFQASAAARLAENGDLVAPIGGDEVRVHKPVAYQVDSGGDKRYVAASYVTGPQTVSFRLGPYDHTRPLVIDPVIGYSSYLGGSLDENDEIMGAIAVDLQGNAYVTGDTDSPDFPVKNPYQPAHAAPDDSDAFVTKISADGSSLVYSTYLGGTGSDQGNAIAVDLLGHVYVAGSTRSADFPVTGGAFQKTYKGAGMNLFGDGFVAKLSPKGSSLLYSTYLGGSSDDYVGSIVVDLGGFAYLAGFTASNDFPVTPGPFQTQFGGNGPLGYGDAFVTKLNPQGTGQVYSTFLGGSDDETAFGIAIDGLGNAYVPGGTKSTNFPATPGVYQTASAGDWDGFVAKLNSAGSKLIYSTYLGGSALDAAYYVALDVLGNAYVSGNTRSTNFPVSAEAFQKVYHGTGPFNTGDIFVAKLNTTATKLIYSTYVGGSSDDSVFGIVLDPVGRVYLTGFTNSTDYPVTPGAFQTMFGGSGPNQEGDALLTVLNTEASALLYSTYFGGSGDDPAGGIVRDLAGNIYITGSTNSPNFYVTPKAFQTMYGGAGPAPEKTGDAFVVRFNPDLF